MRKKLIPLVLGLLIANIAVAQDEALVIESTDAAGLKDALGKKITVTGKVSKADWSRTGKVMNVEFEESPKFNATVFSRIKEKIDNAFAGDVSKAWTGAKLKITGKLEEYKEHYQIIINDPSQVTVMEAPTTAPTTAPAK